MTAGKATTMPVATGGTYDVSLHLDDLLQKYVSSTELARMAGTDLRWVQRQCRRLNIQPALTLGERQFTRADTLKLLLLAQLQRALGDTSPTPFKLLEAAAPAIEDLLANPTAETVIVARIVGQLSLVVSVPRLAELLAGAA